MKKVLFIITSPSAGGAETYLIRFLEYVTEIESTVLCKKSKDGELRERYLKVCSLQFVGSLGLMNPIPYFKFYLYLKRNKFDVICDLTGNFSAWDLLCGNLAGIDNRIAFYRESRNQFNPTIFKNIYAKFVTHITHRVATKILSNSYEALNHFHPNWKSEASKYTVIYNGLDMKKLSFKTKSQMRVSLCIPDSAYIICHSGRLANAKNHSMIINCAIMLCKKYPSVYFVLMGRGVKERYYEVVRNENLEGRILFLGYRNDVLDILKCADLFYFPSLNEGQPNALIEAMASDLPFVASNIPSIQETVPDFCAQHLVDPTSYEDNYKALEEAILHKEEYTNNICGEWTRNTYESQKLFSQFKDQLI